MTDSTQDRCQHKRRRMKCGEMPSGRENEDKTQAGGDDHCYQWPQRGISRRRVCISHLGATSTRAIVIQLVGVGSTSQIPPSPWTDGRWGSKREMLCVSRPSGFLGAPQRAASEGRWPAHCWLTRTRACLCASASTAREC